MSKSQGWIWYEKSIGWVLKENGYDFKRINGSLKLRFKAIKSKKDNTENQSWRAEDQSLERGLKTTA